MVKAEKKYRINVEEKWYTDYIYDDVHKYNKSVIGVRESDRHTIGYMVVDKKYTVEGFSIEDGKTLFCIENIDSCSTYTNYCIIKTDTDKVYVFFDDKQKVFGPFVNAKILEWEDCILLSKNSIQKDTIREVKGIYDEYGNVILPIKYDEITFDKDKERFIVDKKGKKGYYDIDGKCLIKPIYDGFAFFGKNDQFVKTMVRNKAKYGVFTPYGEKILWGEYDHIKYLEKYNAFIVKNDGLYGLYNSEGYNILPITFESYDIIGNTPFISLLMNGRELYYNLKNHRFYQTSALILKKYNYRFFDEGKWITVPYED